MQLWDYEVREIQKVGKTQEVEALLKAFGEAGYELVSLTPVANSAIMQGNSSHLLAVFKRPRAMDPQQGENPPPPFDQWGQPANRQPPSRRVS